MEFHGMGRRQRHIIVHRSLCMFGCSNTFVTGYLKTIRPRLPVEILSIRMMDKILT